MILNIWPGKHSRACEETHASTRIHENGIPDFAEAALESLYECHMTTMLRFQQYYPLQAAKTYVSRTGEDIDALFIFRKDNDEVHVYNEQISISPYQLRRFAETIFRHYPDVRRLSLYAVDAQTETLPFPHQRLECLEDITLPLPPSQAEYVGRLGKNMGTKIKRSEKRLLADFASVKKECSATDQVPDNILHRIIEFSRMRMSVKGQTCYHTDEETHKMIALVRRYGIVCTVTLDGDLCAGVIMLRIGSTYTMLTIAHHPDYDRYNLGTLSCYYGIIHAIENGGKRFNFGWGPYEYKYRLLGQHTGLHRIHVYRTPAALAVDAPAICKRAILARRRNFKLWMGHPPTDEHKAARLIRRALHAARLVRANLAS